MYFTKTHRLDQRRVRLALWTGLLGLGALASCSTTAPPEPAPVAKPQAARPSTAPATTASTGSSVLPPPSAVRNWNEVRVQAAKRMVAANPGMTYTGDVPEPLLAIPVLEVELHADGSVRRISVMRTPSQATDTIKLATEAVQRAAPFGDVSKLPKPWRFTETFLFDDDRKFKPRTLDQ